MDEMLRNSEASENNGQSLQLIPTECLDPNVKEYPFTELNTFDGSKTVTPKIPDSSQNGDQLSMPTPVMNSGRLDRAHILQEYKGTMMSIQEEQRVIYKALKDLSQKTQLWAHAASKLDNLRGVKRLNESLNWIDSKEVQLSHTKQEVSSCVAAVERALSVLGTPVDAVDCKNEST